MTQGNGGTTSPRSKRHLSDQDLDKMVDAYFDRELSTNQRRQMFDQLSGKGGRCEDIARMQRILAQLREPPNEIDVTHDVVAQINERRSFLSPAMRSAVRFGRMAIAASILLALLGIVVVQRIAPDATSLVAEKTPVASLMHDTGSELSQISNHLVGVSEQAAQVLVPKLARFTTGSTGSVEITISVGQIVDAPESNPYLPAREHPQLQLLSGAGDTFVANWYQEDAPRGFAIEMVSAQAEGFRPIESRVISTNLSARVIGEHARFVPYYVEHFEAGALPVSFDPEFFQGVLQFIAKDAKTTESSDDSDR